MKVLWQNQEALSKGQTENEQQFAVLVRMTTSYLRNLQEQQDRLVALMATKRHWNVEVDDPDLKLLKHHRLPDLSYGAMNELFAAWNAFVRRPDFRQHLPLWYLGGDLSGLPDLEEPHEGRAESIAGDPNGPQAPQAVPTVP